MSKFKKLNRKAVKWGYDVNILQEPNLFKQISKTIEEAEETRLAISALIQNKQTYTNKKSNIVNTDFELRNGIGDMMQTIAMVAHSLNLDILECWDEVITEINERVGKGKTIDGEFIKEADLKDK